jgi:hypothetical protein
MLSSPRGTAALLNVDQNAALEKPHAFREARVTAETVAGSTDIPQVPAFRIVDVDRTAVEHGDRVSKEVNPRDRTMGKRPSPTTGRQLARPPSFASEGAARIAAHLEARNLSKAALVHEEDRVADNRPTPTVSSEIADEQGRSVKPTPPGG